MQRLMLALTIIGTLSPQTLQAEDGESIWQAPITVIGRALDSQGKPIEGASIFIASVRASA